MTDFNLVGLLDRIHAVNQEIAVINSNLTLQCHRYYPNLKIAGALPIIVPIVPSGTHNNEEYGSNNLASVWTIPMLMLIDNFTAGSSPADAQANCELCIQHVLTEYWNRPRLELRAATATQTQGAYDDIMEDVRITANTTIEVVNDTIASVRFTLIAETVYGTERI